MINVGHILSSSPLQLMITSCLVLVSGAANASTNSCGIGLSAISLVSIKGSAIACMKPSLPAEDEAIDAVLNAAFDELVARASAPRREVGDGTRVSREH